MKSGHRGDIHHPSGYMSFSLTQEMQLYHNTRGTNSAGKIKQNLVIYQHLLENKKSTLPIKSKTVSKQQQKRIPYLKCAGRETIHQIQWTSR